ncbi:MAG: substrate-binding domain-containing protein [Planctomycetes bacterium]|nr:substrate-binding domain-containing protein [Planctomycetota bacterium]
MKRILPWMVLACAPAMLMAGLLGCRPGGSGDAGGDATGTATTEAPDAVIGVSVLTMTNPFFNELSGAIVDEGAKHNYKVIVTSGEMDPQKQDQQVDDFITKQVDAIVLCPCDSRAVGATIQKANRAGIPVFTADIASLAEEGDVVCHVATDNLDGGRAAARAVVEMLDGEGKIAMLNHPRIESAILREKGFKEEIEKHNQEKGGGKAGIEIVTILPGGGERKMSFDAAKDILQTYPDLDGLFAINDPSAMGAAEALKAEVESGRIRIVGFDAQTEAREATKEGTLYATIVQYPKRIGSTVADAAHQYLVGKDIDPEILIPVTIYRKADADADPMLNEKSGE